MTATAGLLLTVAALIHVGWNLIGKSRHSSASSFLIAIVIGLLVLTPFPFLYFEKLFQLPPAVWGYLVLTGAFQAIYYIALAEAYRRGEMSMVYPLARSLPALFVALLAVVTGKGDRISLEAYTGILLIVVGAIFLPMSRIRIRARDYASPAFVFAIVAALGTTGYSRIDDAALGIAWSALEPEYPPWRMSALYSFVEGVSASLWLAIYVALVRSERRSLGQLVSGGLTSIGGAALMGIGIYATYTIVLVSMKFVREVSYVVAFRQLSIPVGALLGILLLNENRSSAKLLGIALMVGGVLLVGSG